ncbi:hypothetical protein [Treponema sp. TIM-1]
MRTSSFFAAALLAVCAVSLTAQEVPGTKFLDKFLSKKRVPGTLF